MVLGYDDSDDSDAPVLWDVDIQGDFPLHWAVAQGDVGDVERILAGGADARQRALLPSYTDEMREYEPMDVLGGVHWRFRGARALCRPDAMLACMRLLLAAGATVDTERDSLWQMIAAASCYSTPSFYKNFTEIAREMILYGGYDVATCGKDALIHALSYHMYDIADTLLHAGAFPDVEVFRHAVMYHPLDVVVSLLDHGANPYWIDPVRGGDALHWIRFTIRDSAGCYYDQKKEDAKNAAKLKCIEDLWECRRAFDEVKDTLHRELVEHVFHPARLARLGYFSVLQTHSTLTVCTDPAMPEGYTAL